MRESIRHLEESEIREVANVDIFYAHADMRTTVP